MLKQETVIGSLAVNIFIAALFFAPMVQAQQKKPADIPVEAFAALPNFDNAKLSPSANKLAFYIELDGKREIFIQNIDGTNPMKIPPQHETNFVNFRWATDDMMILQTSLTDDVRIFRPGKVTQTRVVSINLTNGEFIWLGRPKNIRRATKQQRASQLERIVDMLPSDPDHLLIELDLDQDNRDEVYRVNITNGERKTVKEERRGIQNWFTDTESQVRLGTGYNGERWVARFRDEEGNWNDLSHTDWASNVDIEDFGDTEKTLYVSGKTSKGKMGLFELDIQSGEILRTLFSHDHVDMDWAIEHPVTGRVAGVNYTDDFMRIEYFDTELATIQKIIDKALPITVNRIMSRARDKEWYLIYSRSDQNPGDYFIFDRSAGEIFFVAASRSKIDPALMATTKAVSIPVRDGSEIPAYLLTPAGSDEKPRAAVVLPHGGPSARSDAEWDFEAQFYASRGYVVLQPNFRGSTGYGPDFRRAGRNQWGGLMQDDVTDATKWLIDEGLADPSRICIVGNSYGGYAALMGVIKEPGLYKCAISTNGVTDLGRLKSNDRNTIGGRVWIKNMGLEGVSDTEVSPFQRAKDISAPVLLMSSVDDARVPWKMAQDMHKRLRKLKKDSEYVKIKDGTHNMVTAQSRLTMLKAAEKFLAKHLTD